jgi:predicted TIM-barrel fold metal-dependent hydrolase
MTTVTPVRPCISADSHVTEPGDTYVDRIDPRYRDRAPVLRHDPVMGATMFIDPDSPTQGRVPYSSIAGAGRPPEELGYQTGRGWETLHPGGYDARARLAEQDRDGVVAEIIYPSVGMLLCNHPDRDYQHACFDAYNDWLAEWCAVAPDRLIGLGQTALRSVAEGIADLERIKDLGLRGVMLPGFPGTDEDYHDPAWDPFWRAVVELGLPPSFHILTAKSMIGSADWRGPKMNSFLGIIRANQDIIGTLVYGGVFERHPDLRVVCVEADAGWAPHYMYRMDHAFKRHRHWLESGALSRLPSEYFRDSVYLTFQDDWVAFKMLDLVNEERLMWANDHPHSDATWPWSQEMLTEQTAHMTEHQKDRVLRDNCKELYGLSV